MIYQQIYDKLEIDISSRTSTSHIPAQLNIRFSDSPFLAYDEREQMMLENRHETVIKASIESVWQILTDLEKYAEWNPLLYQVIGKVEVGETVIAHAKTASKDMKFICTVTRVEPLREFAWRFPVIHPILFRGEHIFRIEPLSDSEVKFIDREWFKGLLLPTQAKDLKSNGMKAMIDMGNALKNRAEQH